jgi:hypothetical protein
LLQDSLRHRDQLVGGIAASEDRSQLRRIRFDDGLHIGHAPFHEPLAGLVVEVEPIE